MAPRPGIMSFEGPLTAGNEFPKGSTLVELPDIGLAEETFAVAGESGSGTEACDVPSVEGWIEVAAVGHSRLGCVKTEDGQDHEEWVSKLGAFEGSCC